MDFNGVREVGWDDVYDSFYRRLLLRNRLDGNSGKFASQLIILAPLTHDFIFPALQVYISEISSPDIRGFLSAIQKVSGHLGVLISYLLGAYLDWRQLAMLVSVAPMMLFVTVIYIPETPSFLVLKGRDEDAYRWVRISRTLFHYIRDISKERIAGPGFGYCVTY